MRIINMRSQCWAHWGRLIISHSCYSVCWWFTNWIFMKKVVQNRLNCENSAKKKTAVLVRVCVCFCVWKSFDLKSLILPSFQSSHLYYINLWTNRMNEPSTWCVCAAHQRETLYFQQCLCQSMLSIKAILASLLQFQICNRIKMWTHTIGIVGCNQISWMW